MRPHAGAHSRDRPQGRDVHRGRRQRVPQYVVRGLDGLTGEYSIRVYEKNFTCKYEVSVERSLGSDEPYDEVASRTEAALKAHTGVRPAKVIVYDAGKLGTSSEHKASRFIDERGCVTR